MLSYISLYVHPCLKAHVMVYPGILLMSVADFVGLITKYAGNTHINRQNNYQSFQESSGVPCLPRALKASNLMRSIASQGSYWSRTVNVNLGL